jgi:iron complex transport system substrate-binding protein
LTNPDVIVVRDASQKPTIMCDSRWQKINAVKNGKVYVSLWSVFRGRARTADGALTVPEAAKRLPELFPDTDMNHTIREFYSAFCNYDHKTRRYVTSYTQQHDRVARDRSRKG